MANIENIILGATAGELVDKINELIAAVNAIQPATSYNDLEDKPSVNGVTLSGNKTTSQLGVTIAGASDFDTFEAAWATKQYVQNGDTAAVEAAEAAAQAALSGKLDADLSNLEDVAYIGNGGHILVLAGGKLVKMTLQDLASYTEVKNAAAKSAINSGIASQRKPIELSGNQDGVNTDFETETGFVLGTTALYLNGQLLTLGKDYAEVSSYQITMLSHIPISTDVIILMAIPIQTEKQ